MTEFDIKALPRANRLKFRALSKDFTTWRANRKSNDSIPAEMLKRANELTTTSPGCVMHICKALKLNSSAVSAAGIAATTTETPTEATTTQTTTKRIAAARRTTAAKSTAKRATRKEPTSTPLDIFNPPTPTAVLATASGATLTLYGKLDEKIFKTLMQAAER